MAIRVVPAGPAQDRECLAAPLTTPGLRVIAGGIQALHRPAQDGPSAH